MSSFSNLSSIAEAARLSGRRSRLGLLIVLALALAVASPGLAEQFVVTPELVEGNAAPGEVPWKMKSGDDPAWADPELDDADWTLGSPNLTGGRPRAEEWSGTAWYRLRFEVQDGASGRPLALGVSVAGAAEVYLDGRRIGSFGRFSVDPEEAEEVRLRENLWLTLSPGEHLVAVRLACHLYRDLRDQQRFAGVSLVLRDPAAAGLGVVEPPRSVVTEQVLFTSVAAAFCLLQILLYLHDRRRKQSLYLALVTAGFTISAFLDFQKEFDSPLSTSVLLYSAHRLFLPVWLLLNTLFIYSLVYPETPKRFRYMVGATILFLLAGLFYPPILWKPLEILGLLFFAELLRAGVLATRRLESEDSWILGFGMLALGLGAACDLVVDLNLVDNFLPTDNPYLYGGLILLVAMSVYMARGFSRTNRELERQLVRVQELSEVTLAQERAAREVEIERRVLEVDNARKTEELEQARQLQLSLLPDELPRVEGWEIAASMRTATEVGGDYYDFSSDPGMGLTLVVGDAAGHGARAGVLVAATKSVFGTLGDGPDLVRSLGRMGAAIGGMNLKRLHMALLLARVRGRTLEITSAGMPPALVFRSGRGEVEEIVVPGTPLGSASRLPYKSRELTLEPGDAVLFMSDGLPELMNDRDEQVGYERSCELFGSVASRAAGEIVESLEKAVEDWTGGKPPGDDVTFVVLKAIPS